MLLYIGCIWYSTMPVLLLCIFIKTTMGLCILLPRLLLLALFLLNLYINCWSYCIKLLNFWGIWLEIVDRGIKLLILRMLRKKRPLLKWKNWLRLKLIWNYHSNNLWEENKFINYKIKSENINKSIIWKEIKDQEIQIRRQDTINLQEITLNHEISSDSNRIYPIVKFYLLQLPFRGQLIDGERRKI